MLTKTRKHTLVVVNHPFKTVMEYVAISLPLSTLHIARQTSLLNKQSSEDLVRKLHDLFTRKLTPEDDRVLSAVLPLLEEHNAYKQLNENEAYDLVVLELLENSCVVKVDTL
ncbi:hypothetical protein MTBPR1_140025 [Candidatus Terasakiella magnetica]|uniref:Uncharacterized protein n=1 Tax=Candidatus Terasakiella magnetica TaxID=1867952 RepID=A0A1C3RF49_9PROT|nr:hypothetical protein MTBPR1_140025 [Candidatus Terasakiella magnetica]